ncbi:hypothetical protein MFFC18_08530 [Mariniblastus fucicola]|uniref:Uncharacterized protein n=1 Tax=Mariniblastus fucicola TaxID=980251 RepID=A0A5B9PD75_9BACT|nr:hypothetical protein MFFC18_08530 [Mariniblastus fucicola]
MMTFDQVVQHVTQQVDAIEPVHRSAQPRKPHDEGGGVDVLTSATRAASDYRMECGVHRPGRGLCSPSVARPRRPRRTPLYHGGTAPHCRRSQRLTPRLTHQLYEPK